MPDVPQGNYTAASAVFERVWNLPSLVIWQKTGGHCDFEVWSVLLADTDGEAIP
jgi:hypothetical protein